MIHLLLALTLFQLYQGDFNGSAHYTVDRSYLYPREKNIEQFDLSIDLNFSQRIDLTISLDKNYTIQASESSITISKQLIQRQIIQFDFNGLQCKYQFQGYLSKSNLRTLKLTSFEIGILDSTAPLEYFIEKPTINGFFRLQIEILSGSGIMGFVRCYKEKHDCQVKYEIENQYNRFIDFEYILEECYFDACQLIVGVQANQLSHFRLSLFTVNKTVPHRVNIDRNQLIDQQNVTHYSVFGQENSTLTLLFTKGSSITNAMFVQALNTLSLKINQTGYVHFQIEQSNVQFRVELLNDDLAIIPQVILPEKPIVALKDDYIVIERSIFIQKLHKS